MEVRKKPTPMPLPTSRSLPLRKSFSSGYLRSVSLTNDLLQMNTVSLLARGRLVVAVCCQIFESEEKGEAQRRLPGLGAFFRIMVGPSSAMLWAAL